MIIKQIVFLNVNSLNHFSLILFSNMLRPFILQPFQSLVAYVQL